LELYAIREVFKNWSAEPVNIVCDSLYVVGIVQQLERAVLKEVNNHELSQLLTQLWQLINCCKHEYFIVHIRSHSGLPGSLVEGNKRADQLVAAAWNGPPLNAFQQAQSSHFFFHQAPKMLTRQFDIPLSDAKGIVQACPDCQGQVLGVGLKVNP
ncbi:POK18 protein, partial [Pluvianellus socialis]|nr:POK18 protein [Pluvianellus socialis]